MLVAMAVQSPLQECCHQLLFWCLPPVPLWTVRRCNQKIMRKATLKKAFHLLSWFKLSGWSVCGPNLLAWGSTISSCRRELPIENPLQAQQEPQPLNSSTIAKYMTSSLSTLDKAEPRFEVIGQESWCSKWAYGVFEVQEGLSEAAGGCEEAPGRRHGRRLSFYSAHAATASYWGVDNSIAAAQG